MPKILRKQLLLNLLNGSPIGNTKKGYDGELKVLSAFENNLPASSTVIWDPIFIEYKPDFLIIDPELGFLFVEVKNWSPSFIKNFNKNGTILTKSGQKHPLKQTDNYINELNSFLQSFNLNQKDIYRTISSIVIFPNLILEEFSSRSEVLEWTSQQKNNFCKNHYFKDDLNSNLFQKMLSSKKFSRNFKKIFTLEEVNNIISSLGVESVFLSSPKVFEKYNAHMKQPIMFNNKYRIKIKSLLPFYMYWALF